MKPDEPQDELRPCCFCGEDDLLDVEHDVFDYVLCHCCDAKGPPGLDYEQAVRLWNERAGETQQQERGLFASDEELAS